LPFCRNFTKWERINIDAAHYKDALNPMNTDPRPQPTSPTTLTAKLPTDHLFRVLSLDGGGAKGFYTLGVLKEIEGC
jgi:hypothetical protein